MRLTMPSPSSEEKDPSEFRDRNRERVKLFEHPLRYYFTNLFVLTEHRAYFIAYRKEFDWPSIKDILMEIFDLDDPEVYTEVEARFSDGKIIVGYYYSKTGHVTIIFPDKRSGYVQKRREVFGK